MITPSWSKAKENWLVQAIDGGNYRSWEECAKAYSAVFGEYSAAALEFRWSLASQYLTNPSPYGTPVEGLGVSPRSNVAVVEEPREPSQGLPRERWTKEQDLWLLDNLRLLSPLTWRERAIVYNTCGRFQRKRTWTSIKNRYHVLGLKPTGQQRARKATAFSKCGIVGRKRISEEEQYDGVGVQEDESIPEEGQDDGVEMQEDERMHTDPDSEEEDELWGSRF